MAHLALNPLLAFRMWRLTYVTYRSAYVDGHLPQAEFMRIMARMGFAEFEISAELNLIHDEMAKLKPQPA